MTTDAKTSIRVNPDDGAGDLKDLGNLGSITHLDLGKVLGLVVNLYGFHSS
jgi:hypothetical protein